ncbi:hypothetical protein HMSSN036_24560 [Paenibacillus macerans]|nr:hypothetical protein HMSSN036_24560 [Paenibacillus macerans]
MGSSSIRAPPKLQQQGRMAKPDHRVLLDPFDRLPIQLDLREGPVRPQMRFALQEFAQHLN